MSNRILFFGNERLATGVSTDAPVLRALLAAGYDIPAVVAAQNDPGPSRQTRQLEISKVAAEYSIPVVAPADLNRAVNELARFNAEAAVLIAYGQIIPPAVLEIFPKGIINIHPSLLPRHRGPTPIESVILNGEIETGVSLMQLSPKMDAGPVYAQVKVELTSKESKQELADRLALEGKDLLLNKLPGILDGSLVPQAQDESRATYDKPLSKPDGELDFNKPAQRLAREVRACAGWPRSRTKIGQKEVIITAAHTIDGVGKAGELFLGRKQLGFYTSNGILLIDSLIPAGKKEMPAQAFLAGYLKN